MIARITLSQLQYSQTFQNVFHIYDSGTFDKDAINSAIQTYWIGYLKAKQLSSVHYRLIQIRDVSTPGQPTWNFPIDIGCTGGSAIETWGPLCALFSFHTAAAGRSGRGRFYMSGQYVGDVQAGVWSAVKLADLATTAAGIFTRWGFTSPTSGYRLAVTSRSNPTDYKSVTEIVAQAVPGVQRRRNYGVGI